MASRRISLASPCSYYVPPIGQEFDVLTAASVTGRFSKVEFVDVPAERAFLVRYDPQKVTLVAHEPRSGLTYEGWKARTFSAEDQANDVVSAPEADPDGDGLSNLLEYAFALNPAQPDTRPVQPAVESGTAGSAFLVLTFPWADDLTDVEYSVSTSTDLRTWSPATTELLGEKPREGAKRLQLRVPSPVPQSQHLFARFEVRQRVEAEP